MAGSSLIVLCASALFVQTISASCVRAPVSLSNGCGAPTAAWGGLGSAYNLGSSGFGLRSSNLGLANTGCGFGTSGNIVQASSVSSTGGNLGVSSSSPLTPEAVSVLSENDITGQLYATGELPVLAAVAVEGEVPTSGSAGTSYSCGNGQVGIDSNSLAANGLSAGANAGYSNLAGFNNAANGFSFGGCGCGAPIRASLC